MREIKLLGFGLLKLSGSALSISLANRVNIELKNHKLMTFSEIKICLHLGLKFRIVKDPYTLWSYS